MKLTLDQALQKGIEAHKAGHLQDAERYYSAILKAHPSHPDANHNLGVLAMGVNKAHMALPFFEKALQANPTILQFWESHISALVKLNNIKEAKDKFSQLKNCNFDNTVLTKIENKLFQNSEPDGNLTIKEASENEPTKENLDAVMKLVKAGQFKKSLSHVHELQNDFPRSASLYNLKGAIYAEINEDQSAINCYQQALKIKPNFPIARYNLGNIFKRRGNSDDAIANFKEALKLKPDLFQAYYNLGNIMKEMDDLDGAINNYGKVIEINPNFVDAYFNLGATQQEKGNFDQAIQCYKSALKVKPKYLDALNNMGCAYLEKGEVTKSLEIFKDVIRISPDFHETYFNIAFAIEGLTFTGADHELEKIISVLLDKKTFARPRNIVKPIFSLLSFNHNIQNLYACIASGDLSKQYENAILALSKVPLLWKLLKVCPAVSIKLEAILTQIRLLLLKNCSKINFSGEVVQFQSMLALQCFLNEYVYTESSQELEALTELENRVNTIFLNGRQPAPQMILCLASYKALYEYEWCHLIEVTPDLDEVYKMQISEPYEEEKISSDIPLLQKITDEVSLNVRNQYEENPYPRWVNSSLRLKPGTILEITKELRLDIPKRELVNSCDLDILNAGCGTGLHPISTARRFKNCKVLAVDLSLRSLSYAKRKSEELSIENIDYMQADILDLEQLNRKFDLIESCGVLHHMDDPMAGWRVLVNCLKKGGLMNIGLYSEVARKHIIEVRKEISQETISANKNEMKSKREHIKNSSLKHHREILSWGDFYSLSEYRDLLFHVQEHTFTIPQIKLCLEELGLVFCGFEVSWSAEQMFRLNNTNHGDLLNLDKWKTFEDNNPAVFSDMYQFWCQKII